MSNTDAGYTPSNGTGPEQTAKPERAPFPVGRFLMSILFGFISWFAFGVAIFAAVIYWIMVAINREPHSEFRKIVGVIVAYVSQTLGYVAWLHDETPFPFGPLPKSDV